MNASTARFALTAGSAAALLLTPLAGSEPVVLRFDPGIEFIEIGTLSAQVPELTLGRFQFGHGGSLWVYPGVVATGYDPDTAFPDPPPFEIEHAANSGYDTLAIGAPVTADLAPWNPGFTYFEPEIEWPMLLSGCGADLCAPPICGDQFSPAFGSGITDAGVYSVPVRFSNDAGTWNYGWIAFRVTIRIIPECNYATTPPSDYTQFGFEYAGLGYETIPDTPIINGGGLCESDLNFDAVLDLADVQTFAQSFLVADGVADLNDDGIFDLADIQQFIGSFNTGCGL